MSHIGPKKIRGIFNKKFEKNPARKYKKTPMNFRGKITEFHGNFSKL